MLKRLPLCTLLIVTMVLTNLPLLRAQTLAVGGPAIKISSYRDDPFVALSNVRTLDATRFGRDAAGDPYLTGDRVSIIGEDFIFRTDGMGNYVKFALNPWPKDGRANEKGNFKFADEARFPIHEVERDADGKPILKDGLQVWKPRDLRLGITTAFAASNTAREAAEAWGGRDISWGVDNLLQVETQTFIDFNAFYSPSARQLFFGVVPYRLPGETQIKMFETATSWEMVAHEAGHALQAVLKPNRDYTFPEFEFWGESFGDQTAMWASLTNPDRVRAVLAETGDNLYSSNSLTRFAEAFATLTGKGTGIRDAFHDLKISDTSDEVHDRSQVLTGAVYKIFTLIYNDLKNRKGIDDTQALTEAGDIMGVFLIHTTDHTPELRVTLEDVGKAYLKVDKDFFNGRYHNFIADEFLHREIFNPDSVNQWLAHEAALPSLQLPKKASDKKVDKLIQDNLDQLGIGPDFGLQLQSVTRDERFKQTIVRVQLTDGRGEDAQLFANCGILVFGSDRALVDYQSPFPEEAASPIRAQANAHARAAVNAARRLRLDQHGGQLAIVRRPNGQLTIEAGVMHREGINCWIEAFTLEHPEGERREVIVPTLPRQFTGLQPNGVELLTADKLHN